MTTKGIWSIFDVSVREYIQQNEEKLKQYREIHIENYDGYEIFSIKDVNLDDISDPIRQQLIDDDLVDMYEVIEDDKKHIFLTSRCEYVPFGVLENENE